MRRSLAARKALGRHRPTASMAVAVIALVFAATGGAIASTYKASAANHRAHLAKKAPSDAKADASQISAYFNSHKGSLRGSQGPQGPQGPQGGQGPQGSPGAPGQNATALWAVVREAGTLARGSGVSNVFLDTNGGNTAQYNVTFNRDISNCAYIANAGSTGTVTNLEGIVPRGVTTARSADDPHTVVVEIYNLDGTTSQPAGPWVYFSGQYYRIVEDDFHLAVFC